MGLRRPRRADRGDDVPRAAAAPFGHGGAEAALAAAARLRGGLPRRDRVHRARRRLGRRRHPGDRPPRGRRVRPRRREVLRHERRHRRADDRLREARRRDHRVPRRGGRPRRVGGAQGAEARPPLVVHRLDPLRRGAPSGRPAARRRGRGLRDRDGLLHALAPAGGRVRARDRARCVRVRDRLRERAARVRQAADREAGRLVQAGRHGDAGRGVAAARLACGGGARRRRGRRPARLVREGVRRRRRDERHDRRRPGARRRRDHARPPGREVDARRQGAPDRRGHVRDPAARDRQYLRR